MQKDSEKVKMLAQELQQGGLHGNVSAFTLL